MKTSLLSIKRIRQRRRDKDSHLHKKNLILKISFFFFLQHFYTFAFSMPQVLSIMHNSLDTPVGLDVCYSTIQWVLWTKCEEFCCYSSYSFICRFQLLWFVNRYKSSFKFFFFDSSSLLFRANSCDNFSDWLVMIQTAIFDFCNVFSNEKWFLTVNVVREMLKIDSRVNNYS